MPETRLFPSDICGGCFGKVRFDRPKDSDDPEETEETDIPKG